MFGLLNRAMRRSQSHPFRCAPRTRLGLQSLEGRDCPSTLSVSFGYNHGPERTVIIDGSVTEELDPSEGGSQSRGGEGSSSGNVGNLTVTFSGAVQGTATTDEDGDFSVTLTASSLGAFWAQTTDGNGNYSDYYEDEVTNDAPAISLTAYQAPGGWVLEGVVNDEYAPGLMVTFSSSIPEIDGRTSTVSYSNQFGFGFDLPSGTSSGAVSAVVTDWWGESDDAGTYISV